MFPFLTIVMMVICANMLQINCVYWIIFGNFATYIGKVYVFVRWSYILNKLYFRVNQNILWDLILNEELEKIKLLLITQFKWFIRALPSPLKSSVAQADGLRKGPHSSTLSVFFYCSISTLTLQILHTQLAASKVRALWIITMDVYGNRTGRGEGGALAFARI